MGQNEKKDYYLTIEEPVTTELKIKSSKFIANAIPVQTKENAMIQLGTIRTKYFDATHNCFAYKIGPDGMEFRYSDDGEPNGSAGKPILFAINKYNITDILVVVTRYFGGTKLGVGGLARAYSDTTEEVLKKAKIKKVFLTKNLKIFTSYEDYNKVKQLVIKYAVSYDEFHHDAVELIASIPITQIDIFKHQLTEITANRAGFIEIE